LKQDSIILKMIFIKLRYHENLFQIKNYLPEINEVQAFLQIILIMQNYFPLKDIDMFPRTGKKVDLFP